MLGGDHYCVHRLSETRIGRPDHRNVAHARVFRDDQLDLNWADMLAAADDEVALTPDVPLVIDDSARSSGGCYEVIVELSGGPPADDLAGPPVHSRWRRRGAVCG